MPKCLTPAQIKQYREEGCVFPIRIMSETEVAELRGRLEAFDDRRIGFAIRYIPTTPARTVPRSCAARITITHFMPEPQPSRDLDPEFVALRRTITERNARILYRGTEIASYDEPKALAQRG